MILKEICQVDWGNTDLTKASYVENGEYLAVSAAGCDGRINHYECEANVPVLSAIGAQCGKMFFPNERFTAIKNTITLTPKDGVLGKYLYYLFTAIELPKRGAGQPFISKGDIEKFSIPKIPPIATQQKIVAKLDAIFAEIDKATAAAEANAKNAEALFQSYLTQVLEKISVENNSIKLSELATFRNGINFRASSSGFPMKIFGVRNFKNYFTAPLNDLDEINLDKSLPKDDFIKSGDILFVRSNGNLELIGRCVLFDKVVDDITFSGFTIRCRLTSNSVCPKFLMYFLKSEKTRKKMIDGGNGANIKSLNQTTLSTLEVPLLPSVQSQEDVVNHIELIEAESNKLFQSYISKKNNLESYKSSILRKAFAGELIKE